MKKIDWKLWVALLGLASLTFYPLRYTGFLTADDAERQLAVMIGGLFSELYAISEATGRITLAAHFFLTHIPYLSDDIFFRKIFLILPHVIVIVFFAITAGKYLQSRSVAIIFATFFLVFLTNSWEHNLYGSYPFAFHVSMLGAIASGYFLWYYVNTLRRIYIVLAILSYSVALFTYEQFLVYVSFYITYSYVALSRKDSEANLQRKVAIFSYLSLMGVYISIVMLYKLFTPGHYEGVEMAAFDLQSFFKTIKVFLFSAFPIYLPLHYEGRVANGLDGYTLTFGWLKQNMNLAWALKAVLASFILTKVTDKFDCIDTKKRRLMQAFMVMALIILSVLMISLSVKYQKWVLNSGTLAYSSSSYVAQLFAALLISLLLCYTFTFNVVRQLGMVSKFAVFSVLLLPIIVITEAHNANVLASMKYSANKWRAIDALHQTGQLESLPVDSIIFSPEFIETGGIVTMRKGYWASYTAARYNETANITGDKATFYRPEYLGKRYRLEYFSKSPHDTFKVKLVKESSANIAVYIPDHELTGFYNVENSGSGKKFRWSKRESSLYLCNESDQLKKVRFTSNIWTDGPRSQPLRACVLGICDNYNLSNHETNINIEIDLPPGCHTIDFATKANPVNVSGESRSLYFAISTPEINLVDVSR